MKFLILSFAMLCTSVSYGQFQTVSVNTFDTVAVNTLSFENVILGQVGLATVCENCLLTIPVSYNTEMVSHEMHSPVQKRILFRGDRGGRLRGLIGRLFGRDRRAARGGCGG